MMHKRRRIHAHEGHERAEVEALGADLVRTAAQLVGEKLQQPRSDQREAANSNNIVARNPPLRFDRAEE